MKSRCQIIMRFTIFAQTCALLPDEYVAWTGQKLLEVSIHTTPCRPVKLRTRWGLCRCHWWKLRQPGRNGWRWPSELPHSRCGNAWSAAPVQRSEREKREKERGGGEKESETDHLCILMRARMYVCVCEKEYVVCVCVYLFFGNTHVVSDIREDSGLDEEAVPVPGPPPPHTPMWPLPSSHSRLAPGSYQTASDLSAPARRTSDKSSPHKLWLSF